MSEQEMLSLIHFETQEPGSQLCAVHALNNLLQSNVFSSLDLAQLARNLDVLEAQETGVAGGGASNNYDDSGFFSVGVVEEALKLMGLRLERWSSEAMAPYRERPEAMQGFILNHNLHWYTIRQFSSPNRFYTLDSCTPSPVWISSMHLGLTLREASIQGYSIFVIVADEGANVEGLPNCVGDEFGKRYPQREQQMGTARNSITGMTMSGSFSGSGHSLGGGGGGSRGMSGNGIASGSGRGSIPPRGSNKRTADYDLTDLADDYDDEVDADDDEVEFIEGNVSDESEKRRRRRRLGDHLRPTSASTSTSTSSNSKAVERELTEDEQLERAIAASLGESMSMSTGSAGVPPPVSTTTSATPRQRRGDMDEAAQLEAALLASMQGLTSDDQMEGQEPDEEEEVDDGVDDEPTVDELRRRRLARFG